MYVLVMGFATPFFHPFRRLLFGKTPLSEIEKSLRDPAHSLRQYQQALAAFIPATFFPRTATGRDSRCRLFPTLLTFWAFLAQVLERGSSCRRAVSRVSAWWQLEDPHAPGPAAGSGGYCLARARLEDAGLARVATHLAERLAGNLLTAERWRDRHVKIIDGTSASMPDTPANQAAWPQPTGQKPGCGFPVVRLVGLFSATTGALLRLAEGPLGQSQLTLARTLWHNSTRAMCS
jgi:hypothetical protein